MEEKNVIKINLSTFLLLILLAVITIVAIGVFIFKLNKDNTAKVQENVEHQAQINDENNGTIMDTKTKDEFQAKENTSQTETEQINSAELNTSALSESNILLYKGYEIENKLGIQYPSDMEITDESKEKYNKVYYNYENGKDEGASTGIFGEEIFEGYSSVDNVKKIAMTQKYNAIPRFFYRSTELPKELEEMADCTSVTIDAIDLDNDGKKEKIVCYTVSYLEGQIGNGEPQASSAIMLFDSEYNKIANLVNLQDGFWAGIKEEDKKMFLSLDDVEYIDIDNDGIMEIIIQVPTYDGVEISILKYNNGNIAGEINLEASVLP